MEAAMELSPSQEDYLEAIYLVVSEKGAARATDIARRRKVAASSVTSALRTLVRLGLVNHEPYDIITLTPEGEELARSITGNHRIFKEFLVSVLAIDPETADECACGIEHVIPEEVAGRFRQYLEHEKRCRYRGRKWIEGRGFVCGREEYGDVQEG
jgi:DtxR family Mn-dependent transcriptional regulator